MDQQHFTNYVIPKIIQKFPQFEKSVLLKDNHVANIDFKSNSGRVVLRLTTNESEITIGFLHKTGFLDWHVHMSQFEAKTPDEEIQAAVNLIDEIIDDKVQIIFFAGFGYVLDDNRIDVDRKENDIAERFYWSEL